jgi:hypothetical protein
MVGGSFFAYTVNVFEPTRFLSANETTEVISSFAPFNIPSLDRH